jgi:hypothetical protein
VETIVISYLDAGGFANARYLVRRLRRRLVASATIVLGLWTQSEAAINRSDIVDRTEANAVVTSLAQAVEAVATRGKEPEAQRVQ